MIRELLYYQNKLFYTFNCTLNSLLNDWKYFDSFSLSYGSQISSSSIIVFEPGLWNLKKEEMFQHRTGVKNSKKTQHHLPGTFCGNFSYLIVECIKKLCNWDQYNGWPARKAWKYFLLLPTDLRVSTFPGPSRNQESQKVKLYWLWIFLSRMTILQSFWAKKSPLS